jgi:DsbC/DsbD-like thiol-disulfide interchange protein
MKRRTFLGALAALPAARALAAEQPYQVRLVKGAAGKIGVVIDLLPGWKTYWKVPGDAGIPPQFDWGGADVTVHYPVPTRHQDASGEAIGYFDRVVFPADMKSGGAGTLKLFFAVCKEVCIPANATASLGDAMEDPALIDQWMARVPVPGTAVTAFRLDKQALVLTLDGAAEDVFVETDKNITFRKPVFAGQDATLEILGDVADLKGAQLTITVARGQSGIEQVIRLA